ncbi:R3H domain-containing protein [Heracleum sosnowskyi]|uniref:R3H domain-containing protein n=1 Tax=Heracleum sosnowskyi TaxID=360622 RepID=A0AAD8JCF4_9APIA|nr:R3H domain-containing protein [Heracleum sosnowskyi]
MGGGKRRINKSNRKSTSSLFVQGGILSDWNTLASPPSKGKSGSNGRGNASSSASRSVNSGGKQKGAVASGSGTKVESQKAKKGSVFGYVYPTVDREEGTLIDVCKDGDKNMDLSDPIVLVDSGNTQIFAYVDEKSLVEPQSVKYTYEYSAGLGSDDTSHRGLGFSEELETTPNVPLFSSNPEQQEDSLDSPSFEDEMETDVTYVNEPSEGDDLLAKTPSLGKNSGYLSIGGMKLYTQDISCGESEEDDNELSYGESMESSESEESCGSSESDGSSDSDSSIDEEVAEDYFEGIGGSDKVVNTDLLVGKMRKVDNDGVAGGNYIDTLQKLGGIDLEDASREYGLKKPQSGNKHSSKSGTPETGGYAWSSVLDDLMFVKDYRTSSGKKKHGSKYPQSWPSDAHKGKHFRRLPGEKKKLRKETIANKRRERMIRRGVDLEEINLKLQQMVLDGEDILSFKPMHSRDCSQVRRLADIYYLISECHGSGKKRFVTVIRTERTCMPSSSGKVCLEKLIGAGNEDADFAINAITSTKGDRKIAKRGSKGFGQGSAPSKSFKSSADRNGTKEVKRKNKSEDKRSYAAQPMSFVSSGVMHSESEIRTLNTTETENTCHDKKDVSSSYGAFELHTTGFGSKMMAKMGYVEGEGLGKDHQGRAEVIEVVQRPKSLGLGANAPAPEPSIASSVKGTQLPKKSSSSGAKGPKTRNKVPGNESQQFAAFERHTKGFGSKLMAKMGFVEGTGLGRDSQGIVNPLVASRLPKSRGLGAKG